MAIIYTYPPVTNPDGTELVVVSDTKNQNATRLMSIGQIAGLVPSSAGGTVTSVTLDFNSAIVPAPSDTGLRVWDPSVGAFADRLTITTNGSFDIGGILNVNNGGTGLETSDYATGDMLYFDPFNAELQTVPIGAASTVLTVDPITGTMSNWNINGTYGGTVSQIVSQGDTVNLIGGTVIDTIAASGGASIAQVTINHAPIASTVSTNNVTLVHGGTFTAIDTMGISGEAHVTSHNTTTYTLPSAGGSTGRGFSPCPIAISGVPCNMDNTHHYLTVAEHDMTLTSFMLWGSPNPTIPSNIEFALYRGGTGPTTWTSAVLIAKGSLPGLAQQGSNIGTLTAEPLQNLIVNVGDNLIVGLRRTSGDWDTIGDDGASSIDFGVTEVGSVPFVSLPPQSAPAEDSSTRFALTLF